MKIRIPIGPFRLVFHLIDLDPSDGDVDLGVGLLFPSGREIGLVIKAFWK